MRSQVPLPRLRRPLALLLLAVSPACGTDPVGASRTEPLGIVVSPRTADLNGCVPVRLTAELSGGADDAPRGVVWVSRSPDAISVDPDGLLTVTGGGDAWIVVRAVVDATVADSAFATTRTTTPTLTIRIAAVTAGPDSATVSPDSVAGVVDVTVAVDGVPPCTPLDRVELTVAGRAIASRPAQGTDFTRVFPLDTRSVDPLTSLPRWPDGPHVLRATLHMQPGQSVTTPGTVLTFRNGSAP